MNMDHTQSYVKLLDLSKTLDSIKASIKEVSAKLEERARVKHTIKQLSALSDRELADMGIPRCAITSIAMGEYYRD